MFPLFFPFFFEGEKKKTRSSRSAGKGGGKERERSINKKVKKKYIPHSFLSPLARETAEL